MKEHQVVIENGGLKTEDRRRGTEDELEEGGRKSEEGCHLAKVGKYGLI
jgi:hypothetical protein